MIYKVYYSNIKLQSQIVVPVQTNKAQVCPHIYDNQSQKKKQKKPRKASAQSRVHSSSIFFSSSYQSTVCLDQALAILRRTQRGQ